MYKYVHGVKSCLFYHDLLYTSHSQIIQTITYIISTLSKISYFDEEEIAEHGRNVF